MDYNEQFATTNKHGDEIYLEKDRIFLYLKAKDETRKIGQLYNRPKNGALSYGKGGLNDSEHLFRKTNSYGINDTILQKLPDDGLINIESDGVRYLCTVKHAKEVGHYFHFLPQGFELQCFISKEHFQKIIQ